MLRILATAAILGLLVLDLWVPASGLGRRGREAAVRADIDTAVLRVGDRLPSLVFADLEGRPVRSEDLLGQRVLLTFERSVDW